MVSSGPGSDTPRILTAGDLAKALLRHARIGIPVGLVVAVLVFVAAMRVTPLYEATTTLAVEPRRQAQDFQVDPVTGKVEFSVLNTVRDKMRAHTVVAAALESSGLDESPVYAATGNPVGLAQQRLSIQTSKDSMTLKVAFRDESPERGKRMLEALLEAFHHAQVAAYSDKSSDALSFLARSKQETERELAELRAREQRMRRSMELVDDRPNENIHAQRLKRLNDQLTNLASDLAGAQATMDQLTRAREAEDPLAAQMELEIIARHPAVVEQRRLLYELKDRQVTLAQKYLAKHPRMLEVTEQLRAKREHLTEAVEVAASGIEARLRQLQLQRDELQSRIDTTSQELQTYLASLVELSNLQKEIATTESILASLREHLAEQQILASLDANQATLIDPPRAGSSPVNIRKPLFAAAACLLGALAAMAAAVAAEVLGRKVRSLDRAIEATHLGVVGRIPQADRMQTVHEDPKLESNEHVAEAIRALRARLRLATRDSTGPRSIAITSACPGDGKSTVAAHLAMTLAAAGDSVLLIDADLRQPHLDHQFGVESTNGLVALLSGDAIEPELVAGTKRLRYLGAGTPPENPSDLLHAPALRHLLHEVAPRIADWIVVDTPPLGRVSDALTIGEHCDNLLVVVREGHTLRSDLRRCMGHLAPIMEKILGMVYNAQVHRSEADLYAGYGYGYGQRRAGVGTGALQPVSTQEQRS